MKTNLRFMALVLLGMMLSVNLAWGANPDTTYVWTLASGDLGSTGSPSTSVTKGSPSKTWSTDYTWGATSATKNLGWDSSKGVQIGSGSSTNKCSSFVLSTSGITGAVSEIIINASHASSGGASIGVTVNGVAYCKDGGTSESASCTTSASDYTFQPKNNGTASKGQIVVTLSNSKAKAIYLKKISVKYAANSGSDKTAV